METNDCAIIIPTLNEEHFIGQLLDSIVAQTVVPRQIIVVDAYSQDGTVEEIIKRSNKLPQLEIYQIPRQTISKQRNLGAHYSTTPHLLFLDADTLLKEKDVLEKYMAEVEQRQIKVGAAPLYPLSNNWKDQVYFAGMNLLFKVARPIWPMVSGANLYFRRYVFNAIGGFNEEVAVGEDFEIAQRAAKKGHRLKFFKGAKIYASARRLQKEGRTRFTLKVLSTLPTIFRHGYRNISVEYEFGNFKAP